MDIAQFFAGFDSQLGHKDYLIHSVFLVVNILLLIFAPRIIAWVNEGKTISNNDVRLFKNLNLLILLIQIILLLGGYFLGFQQVYIYKILYSLFAIYLVVVLQSFLLRASRRRFGREKKIDGKTAYIESYSSRLVDFLILIIFGLGLIYTLIVIWDGEALLVNTGLYGILAAFIALTSPIWGPDILSGFIILNSNILEDGDVVVLEGHAGEYVIARITLIYVVLYDIRRNNRSLIRNSKFMDRRIDNLSRIASTQGIRKAITYKIGYPEFMGEREERLRQLAEFKRNINDMFGDVNDVCVKRDEIKINRAQHFEWALTSTGDYALEYTLWVYLERIPSTKITARLRSHLIGTLFKVNEVVYDEAIAHNVDLSTPDVLSLHMASENMAPQSLPA